MKIRTSILLPLLMLCLVAAPVPASAKGVVLNFSDVDISTMVKFISDLTGRNFIMDERVKGKVSVFSPSKLTPDEAFNLFTSVLELKGFTLVQSGKVYKVIPTPAAKQSGTKLFVEGERAPVNETYVARVISLERIPAQDAVSFLQPLVSKDGAISAFGPANMILVVDSALNIQKLQGILKIIDTDQNREKADIIFLQNAGAEGMAKMISEWLRSRDKSGKPGQPGGGGNYGIILPDTRLNALLVFGSEKDKEDVKKLVAMLDVAPPTASSKINVYYLENADAVEVAKVMDMMVKGSVAVPGQQGQPGQIVPATTAPQQSLFESAKITITPDKATNSLVIMASPTDYQNLVQVIQKLDRRSRQVFVQAMIAEVSLDRAKELGVQWGFFGGASTGTVSTAGVYDPQGTFTALLAALAPFGSAVTLNSLGGVTAANFPAILKALQSHGALNILSTPNIMTSDNKEAEIFVGENVPFITSTTAYNTGVAQTSNVERKDTGITLKIKPQISEGEYIKLDLYQEISAVKNPLFKGAAADLTTTKRSAKTSIVVKNNDTVVIGGLIQDQDQENVSKVPLLGDLPLLGYLFKTKTMKKTKTNLMIILTPYVIKDSDDMRRVSELQKQRFNNASTLEAPVDLGQHFKEQK